MELEVLALEPKILASELWILDFGAQNTGHWRQKYWPSELYFFWPEMLPEDVQTFLEKMKSIGSNRISRCNFLQIMVFGWIILLSTTGLGYRMVILWPNNNPIILEALCFWSDKYSPISLVWLITQSFIKSISLRKKPNSIFSSNLPLPTVFKDLIRSSRKY